MDDTQEISDKAHWSASISSSRLSTGSQRSPLLRRRCCTKNLEPRHLTRKAFPDSLRSQSEIDIPPDGSPDCNKALGTVQES